VQAIRKPQRSGRNLRSVSEREPSSAKSTALTQPDRTIFESGAMVASPRFPRPGGAGTTEFGHLFVTGWNLRMRRDVAANSFGGNEVTAVLLLRQELEHVRVPRPDC
jgi:hypothetical protein